MPASSLDPQETRRSRAVRDLLDAALLSAAAAALLVGLEWLFFVTKPSMFSVMTWPQKVGVLLAALLPAIVAAGFLGFLAALLGGLWPTRRDRAPATRFLAAALPSLLLAATALLLAENFTKTVAGFNVGSFGSPVRYLYATGFVLLVALFYHRLGRLAAGDALARQRRSAAAVLAGLLALCAGAAVIRIAPQRPPDGLTRDGDRRLVNVLILSSDGIDANRMSVYGYERKTTPFLDSRAGELLISENHLTNASLTAGSTGALLTGKLPTTTGVTQQFHVFRGGDVYEHLPGVMRQLGYHGIEIGERHYADSHDQNLRRGFHVSNSRSLATGTHGLLGGYGRLFPSESFFLGSIAGRIRERLAHAFGVADMPRAILAPSEQQPAWASDGGRLEALVREIERAPRPFFAHVHLLDTHGPRFRPRRLRFAAGKQQTEDWERDFLDDAILGFDSYVEEMVRFLEERDELESTVLIVNSDHGASWETSERIPLLIRFPSLEPHGRIVENTQRIDIAPTILSYLGVLPPDWMEGESVLRGEIDRLRPIFSTGWSRGPSQASLALIQCQRWVDLNPDSGALETRTLAGHTDPCPESELFSLEETRRLIVARLRDSRHFLPPLALGGKLLRLRDERDPAERRRVARAIRDGKTITRWLDDGMVLARAHWDFWTYGTTPAGLVVINDGDEPLSRRLVVHSGREREFPFSFQIEDGEETREYRFERGGTLTVELAPVAPGSERLFAIWADRALQLDRRRVGVKLATSFGDTLERVRRTADGDERRQMARAILSGEIESRRLAGGLRVAGAYWDHWTRGNEPAALAVADGPGTARITVQTGRRRELPVRFFVEDGESTREYLFPKPGSMVVDLPRSATERLFLVWTDRAWSPGTADRRALGIRISAADDR